MVTAAACSLYVLTMAVGLVAQVWRVRFGRLHHVLYFTVFAASAAALWLEFHPGLVVTLAALAALPTARSRTVWHPTLAAIGLLGYLAVFGLPHMP